MFSFEQNVRRERDFRQAARAYAERAMRETCPGLREYYRLRAHLSRETADEIRAMLASRRSA